MENSSGPGVSALSSGAYLPRDIAEFTGREEEIRSMTSQSASQFAPSIIVIDGMGGVGKTTLALHCAHMMANRYPDGQYFVDLLGFNADQEAVHPIQALNLLLRFNGVAPELIAPGLETRGAQWRSRTMGQKILLVLDNAADAAQIRPLLPSSPGCLVLISSRRRMGTLEGAESLPLDIMKNDEAVALFCRIAGAKRTDGEMRSVETVVQLCGNLPLAIQIAAAQFRERAAWTVSYLVEQLRNRASRERIFASDERGVMSVVTWSYRHLTQEQQRLLRVLSVHPGQDLDSYSAAALAEAAVPDTESFLDDLFKLNLLKQHVPGRYHMHDIVRECTRCLYDESASNAEYVQTVERLAGYYLHSIHAWSQVLALDASRFEVRADGRSHQIKPTGDPKEALVHLQMEFQNSVAVLKLASSSGLHETASQLARSLIPYISSLHYSGDAEQILELGLKSARAIRSDHDEAAMLAALAAASRTHGDSEQAEQFASQALSISRRVGDQRSEISQLSDLGAIYWERRDYHKAGKYFESGAALAGDLGLHDLQARLYHGLALVHDELGNRQQALEFYQLSLRVEGDAGVPRYRALTLNNFALLSVVCGDWQGASTAYEVSLNLAREAGAHNAEAIALVGLCICRRASGAFDDSIEFGRSALELARAKHLQEAEIQALNSIGDAYLSVRDLDTAQQIYEQALLTSQSLGSVRLIAWSREGIAHVSSAYGNTKAAADLWALAPLP
ncbi:tetratricopeptide repeat protein [Actinocrinis puniceicyclus]|uniref:Tetratricopeptide repeat protein n=1 Tax=Actinocrinis puniceicyclus TaxID=977794 RepID=A0A8J7WUK2_9ACTN|nr:tetratricopeptide repeat protein [Actinocrinis puniceicyclus]MBS2967025.1 tetratricopeptide repeat protein [Actinocrinis puniceicyclus]